MSSKLTLSIDETIVRRAKEYAHQRGKSLSKVIEQYLAYVSKNALPPGEITPEVAALADVLPASVADRDWKFEYLSEKYLHD